MKKFIIVPPVYFLTCIILIIIFYFVFPKFNLIKFPYNLIGLLFFIFGLILNRISMNLFNKKKTPENFQKPAILVTIGPYKYSRNPMYSGGLISLIGASVFSGNIFSFFVPVLYIFIISVLFIRYEEKILTELFGNEYLEYKRQVRQWI